MNPQPTIDVMRDTAQTLRVGDTRSKLRALQKLQDATDAAKAILLAELEMTKDYEIDGASTLGTWVRNELRLASGQANTLVRNLAALRDLPLVAEAALAGLMSAEHLKAFTFGLRHVGLEKILQHEQAFVAVALECSPSELFDAVRHLKDVLHPQELDENWRDGMEKEDFNVDALPDGYHPTGFLGTITGAKLKKVLDSISAPRDKDDRRTGAERRVQGLDDLLSAILANGLPADKGVKPHMSVFVDAETVAAAADYVKQETEHPYRTPDPMPPVEPAVLAGHGNIGPHLLMYFLCVSDFTVFLMGEGCGERQAQVLNAGTDRYQPNLKQRRSVLARQQGVCTTPGCNHTHLEIHHTVFWSKGGRTDLDLLIGLCSRCHHLLHRSGLHITGNAVTGFQFTKRDGRPLRRRRPSHHHAA